MALAYNQNDINLLLSKSKIIKMRIDLYDENGQKVDGLSGRVINAPIDISSESNIRRTCSLTLSIPKKEQLKLDFQNTWINRMVGISCGICTGLSSDYTWYDMGKMMMVEGATTYSATKQEVKLSLMDLMASLTSDRGSQMGTGMKITAGSNIRNVLIAIVSEFSPFKRYEICEFEDVIPYDIEIGIGQYPFDALKEVLNLFPYYEMFFDKDGIFTVQKIPTKIEDPVDVGNDVIDPVLIKISDSVKLSDVKNTTEIWGRSLTPMYYATSCVSEGSRYDLTISDTFEELVNGETYGFTPDVTSVAGQTIKIQDTAEYKIYTESGAGVYTEIEAEALTIAVPYVIKYFEEKFILQGELEIHVIVQEITELPAASVQSQFKTDNACREVQWVVNPESKFACVINGIGNIDREIRQVKDGGEYSGIYTTQLAFERAKYENWLRTRLQDTITFESILIPWLDVNQKIEFTSPETDEIATYIVQTIGFDFAKWTMTVKCSRFYPYYPW